MGRKRVWQRETEETLLNSVSITIVFETGKALHWAFCFNFGVFAILENFCAGSCTVT